MAVLLRLVLSGSPPPFKPYSPIRSVREARARMTTIIAVRYNQGDHGERPSGKGEKLVIERTKQSNKPVE